MKKYFFFVAVVNIVLIVSISWSLRTGERIARIKYKVDYIKKYESTLNAMFDNEWELISTENKFEEHEPLCSHDGTRPHLDQFIEWTVEYHDGNGDLRTFIFNNRLTLGSQVQEYVTQYIATYYKEKFYDIYMSDTPLARSSYVFCFFVRMTIAYDEAKDIDKTTRKYQSLLDTPEGTINLSKLTPANAFEMAPIYLSVSVRLSGDSSYGQIFEENIIKQTEDMMDAMNEFANNRLNADVSVGYRQGFNMYTGNRDCKWAFLQGEQVDYFGDRDIFESYKGIFW